MIGFSKHGSGFRGVLNYNLQKGKGRIIGHEKMMGDDARTLSAEFGEIRRINERVSKPVFHASLSLAPNEILTDHQWQEVARKYLYELGFVDNQAVFIRHHDTDKDHLHIVANRIRIGDGKVVNDWREKIRSQRIIRELEKTYHLSRVKSTRKKSHSQPAPSRDELAMMTRNKRESKKMGL